MTHSPIILVADDEPWQRLWITQVLHTAGFVCCTVADGASVVEHALALSPSLIVLDIHLPDLSGIDAAQQLRMLPNTYDIPILFVTSYAASLTTLAQAAIERAEWMMKPFHPEDLLNRVRRLAAVPH